MYKVLLVEDDKTLRLIYSKMKTWSECGFVIEKEVDDGKKALQALENEEFDLIFTDIKMPFMDGIEMLRQLSDKDNTTPVIFASSYDDFEYARQGLILGAFDYLLKPVAPKKLADVLKRVKAHIDKNQAETRIDPVVENVLKDLNVDPNHDSFVAQIASYCSIHYRDNLIVDDFASAHGYSKDYFSKIFKQHFSITFHEFCSRVKVAYAIALLRTGNYKAYEISEMLGYSSVDYFTKIFKGITGTTPSKYKIR